MIAYKRGFLRRFSVAHNHRASIRALIAALTATAAVLAAVPADARHARRRSPPVEQAKPPAITIPPGQLHIIISLNDQRVSVYSDGILAARSLVSTGTLSHPTPLGIFSVIQKRRFHRSNLYRNAPMPFMQRITWSGAALHAGLLPGYPASHGCVRLPEEFAELLWATTKLGARVIIAREDVTLFPIQHQALFAPPPKPAEPAIAAMPEPQMETTGSGGDIIVKDGRIQMAFANNPVPDAPKIAEPPRPKTPVSVFVSRKDKRLYVRQGFDPLFSMPVTIRDADQPIGTHVFTAIADDNERTAMRWIAATMPGEPAKLERRGRESKAERLEREEREAKAVKTAGPLPSPQTAAQALDRLDLPKEARERVTELLIPGSALIISDHELHYETGRGTEFVVRTR